MSIPTRSHVEIAQDELEGLIALGHIGEGFAYAAKEGVDSKIGRLLVVIKHALLLVLKTYKFAPKVIYFNSRLEILGCSRDFITIFLLRLFYWRKVGLMIKSHGSDLEVLNNKSFWMGKIVLPYLKKQVAAWLFLSSEEQKEVIANGYFDPEKIFVTKNIVRGYQFQKSNDFRRNHQIAANSTILLFTGRLIREKGVYEVLDAFLQLANQYDLVLIIVGDGPAKKELEVIAGKANLGQKVIFTGFIPEQQVVPYYANSDMLVFPTYFPEGFPMALFNAVAAGLQVVTTATRAAKDYLVEPHNCLWTEAENSNAVRDRIAELLNSPVLAKTMAEHNVRTGKLFDRAHVCSEISEIFHTISSTFKNSKPAS